MARTKQIALALAAALTLSPAPSVAQDTDTGVFQTFPRLPDTGEAARRINAALEASDENARRFRADCLSRPGSDWDRRAEVPYDGPRFLSVLESLGYFCTGAAHPYGYLDPMTFDRTTGERIDWHPLLPVLAAPAPDADPAKLPPALFQAFLAATAPTPDCRSALEDEFVAFRLWLDAPSRSLALLPVGLAYVDTPCIDIAYLPAQDLAALGAAPALVEALAPP